MKNPKELAGSEIQANDDILRGRSVKKNAFRRVTPEAYRANFIKQVEANILACAHDELAEASMVNVHDRTGHYTFRIGLGGKNEYVANDYHPKDEYIEYDSVQELYDALHVVLKLAKEGAFDDALADLCKRRQARADNMVAAQKEPKGVFGTVKEAA
jgi:hypothetical protein